MKNIVGVFSKSNIGICYILMSAFAFSTMEIVSKTIINQINPFQMNFIRFMIGGVCLLPFAIAELYRRKIRLHLRDFLFFGLTGIIGISISMSFFQSAIIYSKASVVAIIFSSTPIFTLCFARVILKEKLSFMKFISVVVSLFGIVLIFNPFKEQQDILGILLALAAAISFSLYSVIGKLRLMYYGGLVLNCFSFLIGGGVLCVGIMLLRIPVLAGINRSTIPALLYLSFIVTGVGYITYFAAMKHTSVAITSSVFFIKPILAPILAFFILKESLSINTLLGIVCILIGGGVLFYENSINHNTQTNFNLET